MIYETQNGASVDISNLTLKELRLLAFDHSEEEYKKLMLESCTPEFKMIVSDKIQLLTGVQDYRDVLVNRQTQKYPVYSHFSEVSGVPATSWQRMSIKDSHLAMDSLLRALDALDLKLLIVAKDFVVPETTVADNTEVLEYFRTFT